MCSFSYGFFVVKKFLNYTLIMNGVSSKSSNYRACRFVLDIFAMVFHDNVRVT